MRMLHQPKRSAWPPYVFFEKEFSKAECETIISIAKTILPAPAKTGTTEAPELNPQIRISELRWLNENEQSKWLYDRLEGICAKVHQNWYPFALTGFPEPVQITHYFATEGAHYDWHQDIGPGDMSTRKLSMIMLLNDPAEFSGGELEFMGIPGEDKKPKQVSQGTVIAFPSWEFHRVLKVLSGERWSLVFWVHGPIFI